MRWIPRTSLALLLLLAFVGCDRDTTVAPDASETTPVAFGQLDISPRAIADQLARAAGWEIDPAAVLDPGAGLARTSGYLLDFEREDLGNGIAHYFYEVSIGAGPYDLIGLHRVVHEERPGRPGRKLANLFLQHGDGKDFTGMFLPGTRGPNTPDDFGLAIYLAENGVDVWGIDQGWCFIPPEETDQSVVQGWGLQRAADDLRLGVSIARFTRALTSSGPAPMNVLGYSSGVFQIFTAANDEAILPPGQRNLGGLVPADFYFKTDSEFTQDLFCDYAADDLAQIQAGNYLLPIPLRYIAEGYTNDPGGDSVVFPGFTNSEVFWFYSAGLLFFPETFHYFASGDDDGDGFADRFLHVEESWVVDFFQASVSLQPYEFLYDQDRTICGEDDVPWDDNLHLVDLPILYMAARGGADDLGLYAPELTASDDISSVIVSTQPEIETDFAHIDLFLAPIAEELAWHPLLEWVREHQATNRSGNRGVQAGAR